MSFPQHIATFTHQFFQFSIPFQGLLVFAVSVIVDEWKTRPFLWRFSFTFSLVNMQCNVFIGVLRAISASCFWKGLPPLLLFLERVRPKRHVSKIVSCGDGGWKYCQVAEFFILTDISSTFSPLYQTTIACHILTNSWAVVRRKTKYSITILSSFDPPRPSVMLKKTTTKMTSPYRSAVSWLQLTNIQQNWFL